MKYEFNINLSTANIKQTPLLAQERYPISILGIVVEIRRKV